MKTERPQLAGARRGAGIEPRRPEPSLRAGGRDDEALGARRLSRARKQRAHGERHAAIEQRAFARPGRERRLHIQVHLPLAADAQVPGCDRVRARAVARSLRRTGADHPERNLAHVLLETAAAHVPGRGTVLAHEQLRTLVAVRRAVHPDHRGERHTRAPAPPFGQAVEHLPGFEPRFHPIHSPSVLVGPRGTELAQDTPACERAAT
jgi:hypothetical protein